MKNILKIFLILIIALAFIFTAFFFLKFNKVEYQSSVLNSTAIKKLNKKVFAPGILNTGSSAISTDFSFNREAKNDTIGFSFHPSLHENSENRLRLNFNSGDGYSGLNIEVMKIGSWFSSSVETYTDKVKPFDFLDRDRYSIKKQKLILNKPEYKKGDSIFGKIELEIQSNIDDSRYQAGGYFRGKIE